MDLLELFGRPLRVAMIGGGLGSYIGETHRIALRADGLWDLVGGAFSRDPKVSQATGRSLLLDPTRVYSDYRALIATESGRPDRLDAVIVATRPVSHAPIIVDLIEAGFHVIAEKPLTTSSDLAATIGDALTKSGRRLLLTHCYSGYPMVRMARDLVTRGDLGQITMIDTEFANSAYAGGTPPGPPAAGTGRSARPPIAGSARTPLVPAVHPHRAGSAVRTPRIASRDVGIQP